jgi:hypothetical protein
MAIDRKPVTIHYRKFNRAATVGQTLEELVRRAMESNAEGTTQIKERYLARLFTLNSDNYFINTYSDGSGITPLVFGDILHFTKGHLQALCQTADASAAVVPVQQMKAPEQSEYVHSQMFWMLKGDHAFIIQSMSLRTIEFEQYLDWLLKTKTTLLNGAHPIVLDARFDEDEIGGDLGDIQEIIVGGIATPTPTMPDIEGTDGVERVTEVTQHGQIDTGRTTGWDTAKAILRELLGGDANVASLMNAVPADAELNVQVHIGYKTKKRKVDRVALRQLETGLRNLPDSQLQIKSKGARVSADGTIRLHHNASIRLIKTQDGDNQIIGTLLDPADVLRATIEAYTNFVANGKIQE